ncbi:LacI family DNA-binding transcriptional regulator [Actinomycetospora sp.]|uniref:LacI family DNA-binding transcriptional regulator n=1 Tax=Actinomycetospora sp. TaxID=1872135 RepID=UPI002F403EF4
MVDQPTRQITLAQVAQAAGVSPATASRALHGGDRIVGDELRARVVQAARRLRYVPNAHAQALANRARATVGLVMHDVSDPYFAAITRGAMEVAAAHGALVMLGSTFRSPDREIEYVSTFRSQRAQAILIVGSGFSDPDYLDAMRAELFQHRDVGGRYAFVSHHDLPGDAVLPDNAAGGAAVARSLLELGHRRFAVAAGPPTLTTVEHRVAGFVSAIDEAGLPRSAVHVVEREFSENGGRDAAHALVRGGLDATALFCVSDVMAIGALTALREQGVSVPHDLSLIGFDDIPVMRHLCPATSSVRLDLEGMGREAMRLVLGDPSSDELGADGDSVEEAVDPRRVHFPAEVVLRASTTAPTRR